MSADGVDETPGAHDPGSGVAGGEEPAAAGLPAAAPAGPGLRAMSRLIDALLGAMLLLAVFGAFAEERPTGGGDTEVVIDAPPVLLLAVTLVPLAYEILMVRWRGQTLGKMASRIRVVRLDGEPIGWRTAWRRAALPGAFWVLSPYGGPLSLSLLATIYLSAIVMKEGRGIPDRMAGTRVVRRYDGW
jgi:uncharacterized RDD family membrane protein YckC